jgi:predicted MFS family arabinose efflux permease
LGVVSLSLMKPIRASSIKGEDHPVRQMIEGLRFTWNERFLLGAVSLDLFAVLLGGATALLPAMARDVLHVGPTGLGWLRAAPAAGAALVALSFAVKPLKHNVGVIMLWAVVIFGAATAAFGLSTNFAFSMMMLALLGAADGVSVFIRSTLVQLNTPDQMRGRVGAVSNLAVSASNELGEVQSGLAAVLLGGPVRAVVFGGIGAILVTGLWAKLFPELKNARTFEPQYRDTKA